MKNFVFLFATMLLASGSAVAEDATGGSAPNAVQIMSDAELEGMVAGIAVLPGLGIATASENQAGRATPPQPPLYTGYIYVPGTNSSAGFGTCTSDPAC